MLVVNILKKFWLWVPVMVMLQGCPFSGYKYNEGTLPVTPVNFREINTEYDDYNSDIPTFGETFPLCFSSTRNSKGEDFDIVYKLITIQFSRSSGELSFFEEKDSRYDVVSMNNTLAVGLRKINTSGNEFGPFLGFQYQEIKEDNGRYYAYIMLYSNDEDGNQDIRYTHNMNRSDWEDPLTVNFLNSEADDAYPTLNGSRTGIWFCSDREGKFDIYKVATDPELEMLEILQSGDAMVVEKDTILSSTEADDKCPYIAYNTYETYESYGQDVKNNMLVFASNREGGFGGYDLYYSMLEEGEWSPPVNFGAGINSEYDEYRPIVRPQFNFTNDFMLFSSNRPGGLGGFDLYYVGIEDIGYPN